MNRKRDYFFTTTFIYSPTALILTLLGTGCKWKISLYKRGKERGELAQLSIFNFFFFFSLPCFFFFFSLPWKISPLFSHHSSLIATSLAGRTLFRSGIFFSCVCLVTFLWYLIGVFTIWTGTMGRTSGTPWFLISLFRLFFLLGVFVRCVRPGRRRDPPPQSLQEEPSGNGASDLGASWHRHQC